MPRAKVDPIPLASELRPVASLVDTYEKPAPSGLRGLADALGTVDQGLQTLLQTRDQQQEREDELRGRAAYYSDNTGEFATAVSSGKVPAHYSPFYVRGFKNAQGAAAGDSMRSKWQEAWDGWQGKDSEDPEAFHQFFGAFIKSSIGTQDPEVLAGLVPTIEALQQNATTQYTQYRHDQTVQGSLTAHGAVISSTVQGGLDDGLVQDLGADYPAIFSNVNKTVAESLAKGDPDGKAVNTFIDVMSAKMLESRDPQLLDWFSTQVPGQTYTYGQTPHGLEVKNATLNTLEGMAREQAAGLSAKEKREMDKLKDEAQAGIINGLVADPAAPFDEKLLTQAEKNGDPLIRVHAKEWRDTLAKGSSDPKKLQAFYDDVVSGRASPQAALREAMDHDVFGTPEDMRQAVSFIQSYKTSEDTIQKSLDGRVSSTILSTIKERTADTDPINPVTGYTDAGLAASSDFRQLLTQWIIDNPNATQYEIDEQAQKFGKGILDSLSSKEMFSGATYSRNPDLPFSNPFVPGTQQPGPAGQGQQPQPQAEPATQDPSVQEWEKANNITPEDKAYIQTQAEQAGMGYEEYVKQRAMKVRPQSAPITPQAGTVSKISYDPNSQDTGTGDRAGKGLTPELATQYIDKAFTQATQAGLSGEEQATSLLDLIGQGESEGNYNAVYGNPQNTKDLSQLTLDDILGHQQYARQHNIPSTAVGRYGFLYKTLRGLKAEMGLSGSEKFTPQLQDQMGRVLLNRRGLQAYRDGRISKKTFALSLAQEFASLPNPSTGLSYYHGDGLNRSRVSTSAVYGALGFEPVSYEQGAGAGLSFDHPEQAQGVNPQLTGMVAASFKELGLDRPEVISGYRSSEHPVERAKRNGGGEHTHGNAMDVSMKDLSEEQRGQLVRSLIAKGAKRFITYSKHPDMLHVDLKDQTGTGSPYFMFNKSSRHLSKAPAWFQAVAGNV